MSETTRVSDKGQTTIPKEIREKHGIEPGDEVVWIDAEDSIVLKKRTLTEGRGMLVPEDSTAEEREAVAKQLEAEIQERRETEWTIE
jgi:AbrB family looped-hinge helix DNA binding protein